jgi:pyridoxine 5-phosphate synthase
MVKLGVNIDHVATLRQARGIGVPDPVHAAAIVELAGADGITVHLREDRRHIQDRDVRVLRETLKTRLNLEMAANEEIIRIALDIKPDEVCLVPEKRKELTTEGGLDVSAGKAAIKEAVGRLRKKGILVSLFIDPDEKQIRLAREVGADCVELHTGSYALAAGKEAARRELKKLYDAGKYASGLGLQLNAGHGLDYGNVAGVAKIPNMDTLNIGFSIIAKAVFVGLYEAVREMKQLAND